MLSSGAALTMDAVGQAARSDRDALEAAGRGRHDGEFHSLRFVHVAETDDAAYRHLASSRWQGRVAAALHHGDDHVQRGVATAVTTPGEPDDETWSKRLVFGSPDTVVGLLKGLEADGVSHVVCHFDFGRLTQREIIASMELFAERVLPAF